jgi:hypothetical protein
MNKLIPVLFFCSFFYFTQACKPMICPAYQSAFILDDSVRLSKFSLFGIDSLPKGFVTSKDKYGNRNIGIIDDLHVAQREKELKTIEMVTVFPKTIPPPVDTTETLPFTVPSDSLRQGAVVAPQPTVASTGN